MIRLPARRRHRQLRHRGPVGTVVLFGVHAGACFLGADAQIHWNSRIAAVHLRSIHKSRNDRLEELRNLHVCT